jgi:hypothetical protein
VHMGKPLGVRMEGQYAFARQQYARKHFSAPHRALYLSVVKWGLRVRLAAGLLPGQTSYRRDASHRALRTLRGVEPPPYGDPPPNAVAAVREDSARGQRIPVRAG